MIHIILPLFFACHSSDKPDAEDSGAEFSIEDSSVDSGDTENNGDDTGEEVHDPWPEEEVSWDNVLSLVYDGEIISPGDSLAFTSAPAGIDSALSVRFTITNRSEQELTFNTDPSAWLEEDGFTWVSTPPESLASEESIVLELAFNPVFAIAEQTVSTDLHIPISEDPFSVTIEAHVPRPLRMVLLGHNGYTLVSDSYGADFFYEHIPEDIGQTMLAATWGDGLFLRGSRFGGWSSDGFYEYSDDGINWVESTAAGSNFPFACAYGLDEFLCTRGYGAYFTHSTNGSLFLHESTSAGIETFIQAMLFNGTHFVGVGREGTRAIATSTASFDSETVISDNSIGDYNDIAHGQGLVIAVGGTDQYAISISADGGYSWTDQTFSPTNYARFTSIAFNGEQWLVHGYNGTDHPLYTSFDGYDWQPITTVTTNYYIFGAHNGWFIGGDDNGIHRSQDGENWNLVHSFPAGMGIISMATEKWEAP